MAGIGFELKKLFKKKGVFALLKAYGYAGVICTGPMILGVVLLMGINIISKTAGLSEGGQNELNSMITYALMISMIITNFFGLVVTRYASDCLYEEKEEKVIPSLYGSLSMMLLIGGVFYGVFLLIAQLPFVRAILSFILFEELIVVWSQMNYLTAIKDYKGVLVAFAISLVIGLSAGYVLTCVFAFPVITTLLGCVCVAYGLMSVLYHILLRRFFPVAKGSRVDFLRCFERHPALFASGIFTSIGLYGHIIIMWWSDLGIHIMGPFYAAPQYDVPALVAFLSILVSTINFVTSVEVNFYPKYRTYYGLFNAEGTLADIEQAEKEMRTVLQDELSYNAAKQVFATIIFVVVGTMILPVLPLGFDEEMLGIYRVLCLGYACYAIGNSVMLMSLYFCDEFGAFLSTFVLAVVSVIGTIVFMNFPVKYTGAGFVIGAFCYMVVAILRLWYFQRRISYYVLARQPMFQREYNGIFSRIADYFENEKYKEFYNKMMRKE